MTCIDAHVHLHACFDVESFLNAAHRNFNREAGKLIPGASLDEVLCLTEGVGEHGYERLLNHFQRQPLKNDARSPKWDLTRTEEDISIVLSTGPDCRLAVIAGRQIVTRERLEVLALGTRHSFMQGACIEDLICEAADVNAIPIVPWGFGKWTGKRKKILKGLLQNRDLPLFFLGDNANRPAFASIPLVFRMAEEAGIRNLPGSDPLPYPNEGLRAGGYGGIIEGQIDGKRPTEDLRTRLLNEATSILPFGRPETFARFVRNQSLMQWRKLR